MFGGRKLAGFHLGHIGSKGLLNVAAVGEEVFHELGRKVDLSAPIRTIRPNI